MTNKEVSVTPMEIEGKNFQAVMEAETEKRKLITQFIANHMKTGVDFGTIRFGGKESKPSLFKPGSEKFISLFKLTAVFEKDTDTWEMAGSESGVFAYRCLLLDSKKRMVGEGRGVSKLTEKAGWTINNAVKIAEKRAQIDAVLRTGALSDFFTQDLEDMKQDYDQTPVADNAVPTVHMDDHEAPKEEKPWNKAKEMGKKITSLQKKKHIMALADRIVMVPLEKNEYKSWIEGQTGLSLTDEHLDEIIKRLESLAPNEQ